MEIVHGLNTHADPGMAARGQGEVAAVIVGTVGCLTSPTGGLVELMQTDEAKVLTRLLSARVRMVAVDAPAEWAPPGERSRPCERSFAKSRGCGIRFTPDEATAARRADGYFEWIECGLDLWARLRQLDIPVVVNERVIRLAGVTGTQLATVEAREREEVVRRARQFRGSRPALRLDGRTVIVPMHREIAPGTLRSILKQAGLTIEEFRALLT